MGRAGQEKQALKDPEADRAGVGDGDAGELVGATPEDVVEQALAEEGKDDDGEKHGSVCGICTMRRGEEGSEKESAGEEEDESLKATHAELAPGGGGRVWGLVDLLCGERRAEGDGDGDKADEGEDAALHEGGDVDPGPGFDVEAKVAQGGDEGVAEGGTEYGTASHLEEAGAGEFLVVGSGGHGSVSVWGEEFFNVLAEEASDAESEFKGGVVLLGLDGVDGLAGDAEAVGEVGLGPSSFGSEEEEFVLHVAGTWCQGRLIR